MEKFDLDLNTHSVFISLFSSSRNVNVSFPPKLIHMTGVIKALIHYRKGDAIHTEMMNTHIHMYTQTEVSDVLIRRCRPTSSWKVFKQATPGAAELMTAVARPTPLTSSPHLEDVITLFIPALRVPGPTCC